mgnify:CR=1 FL=1
MSFVLLKNVNVNVNVGVCAIILVIFAMCTIGFVARIMWYKQNPLREMYINDRILNTQKKRIENFQNSLKSVNNSNSNSNSNSNLNTDRTHKVNITEIVKYINLFHMYRDGVPDKYDTNGNKISGVEPHPHKAIEYARKAIRHGWGRWGLFEVAQVLQYGIHNFTPDVDKARDLYIYIIRTTKDNRLKKEALEKYQEAEYKINQLKVFQWLNINPCQQVSNENEAGTTAHPNQENTTQPVNVREIIQQTNNRDGQRFTGHRDQPPSQPQPITIRDDKQNVHDSTLLSTIRNAVDKLQKALTGDSLLRTDIVIAQIREYFSTKPDNDKRKDAIKALNAIERNVIPLVSTQIKEVEALQLVWSRIQSKDDETREQLKENLYNQLSECIEHGKAVCSTGRFTRIIDTLNIVDELVTIKPTFAVQQEMMNKCANIRENMLNQLNEQDKRIIDQDVNGTLNETVQFTDKLKDEIRTQLKIDYVDTGIWKQEKLDTELEKWIDFI